MIKIVVDCTSTIGVAEAKELGIISLPMRITFDHQEFWAGDDLTDEKFYELLTTSKNLPKTTQINADDYIKVIQPLLDAGHEVFAMSISSGLSGTFNSLRLASERINSPKLQIFDTETFTIGYYALVMEAIKLAKTGITLAELNEKMLDLRARVQIYTIVDNMKYMVKGGRISYATALIVSTLHIKPIVGVRNKKLAVVNKSIGYNAAKKQMGRLAAKMDTSLPIYYGHANSPEKAEDFRQTYPYDYAACREIGPIIATHGGPGCVGFAFFEQKAPQKK